MLITFRASQLTISIVLVFVGRASLFKDASKILIDIFLTALFNYTGLHGIAGWMKVNN
jgi:hypothetical protein